MEHKVRIDKTIHHTSASFIGLSKTKKTKQNKKCAFFLLKSFLQI